MRCDYITIWNITTFCISATKMMLAIFDTQKRLIKIKTIYYSKLDPVYKQILNYMPDLRI